MCRWLAVLWLSSLLVAVDPGDVLACSCSAIQPRVLTSLRVSTNDPAEPILVVGSYLDEASLYDANGAPIELTVRASGGTVDACDVTYYLLQPAVALSGDDNTLLLTARGLPDAVYTLNSGAIVQGPSTLVDASISLIHAQVEPFEAASGLCHNAVQGETIGGVFNVGLRLAEHAAVFVQTALLDAEGNRVRQLGSTIPVLGDPMLQDRVELELPVPATATPCVTVDLFDWTMAPLWTEQVCLEAGTSVAWQVQLDVASANLPAAAEQIPPTPDTQIAGCSIVGFRSRSTWYKWVALGVALLRSARGRAKAS